MSKNNESEYKKSQRELNEMIKAGFPFVYVVTDDEAPVVDSALKVSDFHKKNKLRNYDVVTWNATSGTIFENKEENVDKKHNPTTILNFIKDYEGDAIFVLHDFHTFLKNSPERVLALKDTILSIKEPLTDNFSLKRYQSFHNGHYKHIIITAPIECMEQELNKLMNILYFKTPGRQEIQAILNDLIQSSTKNKNLTQDERNKIIDASLGLTEMEMLNAYSRSLVSTETKGRLDPNMIKHQKKQIINKEGLLDFHEPNVKMDDIGGLTNLINWVKKRRVAYNETLREKYLLDYPKGLLMTGIQGCGKSYTTKAIASFLDMPLIQLDMGQMMNKWVGESESNIRKAISLAESISPCVLWVDEIDKAIPDPSSGGTHEVTKRILSTLLTWLQEKEKPVFVIATANNIDHLPPELMRKGRFDEIFFIDLPSHDDRKAIFSVHLTKKGYDPKTFDLNHLAERSDGYSGSEIESIVNESLFEAAFQETVLTDQLLEKEIENTNPLSKTMKEKIDKIRGWAQKNNIRLAN